MTDPDDAGVPSTGELLRKEIAGIRPIRFAVLGGGIFLALGIGSIAATLLRMQYGAYPPFGPGLYGGASTNPSDAFKAISSTYTLLTQIWPVISIVFGIVVSRAVADRGRGVLLGSAAVAAGVATSLLVVGIGYTAFHPDTGSIDIVNVFKPATVAVVGLLGTCIGSAVTYGTFESLTER